MSIHTSPARQQFFAVGGGRPGRLSRITRHRVAPRFHLYGLYPRLSEALVRAENARASGKQVDVRMYLSVMREEVEKEIRFHDFDYPTLSRLAVREEGKS